MSSISFNNTRGAASLLQMAPPFAFSDVTMSVFPLRASLPTLENFCKNYLNQAPHLVQFRPFIPFVYLVILDYGRMSVEAANMGWISQREVAFGVPLRWLNTTENGLDFHDWAFTSPFIFVDNELSMSTGREVFGWPKLLARLDPSVSEWVHDPHGSRRVFHVSTKGTSKAYAGETSEYRSLLSVHQHSTDGLWDIPPSLDAVTKPLSQMSSMAMSVSRLSMDLTKTFVGMASDGITGSSVLPDFGNMGTFKSQLEPERMKAWFSGKKWSSGLKDSLWSMFPRLYANTVNFKQFRDTGNPHSTCYQAITAAKMPVTSVKEGGFLGPQDMLFGQLNGGFHIDIHHLAGLPIVDSLGLEVSSARDSDGTTVSTLVPVAPLWMKVDMTYGLGETVVWRGRRSQWNAGKILKDARKAAEKKKQSKDSEKLSKNGSNGPEKNPAKAKQNTEDTPVLQELDHSGFDYLETMNFFNTARGASEAVGGSFSVPDASVRVLPLKADPSALQKFASEYLQIEDQMRFEAWGDFVYLVISDFKQMNSQQSALAKRRARELTLLVPIKAYKWYDARTDAEVGRWWEKEAGNDEFLKKREEHGREKLLTTGFVNAFNYVDDVETAITANEVFGVPSMGSTIAAAENNWLSADRGSRDVHEDILKMRAKVLPELMAGAKAVDRTLIEVCGGRDHRAYRAHETREKSVNRWVELLIEDLARKERESPRAWEKGKTKKPEWAQEEAMTFGEGFALGLLSGETSFNQFSLKQFRDSQQTQDACYQGLVQRRHRIRKITDVSELAGPLHVSITDFPTQPVTEILGLIPKFSYPGKDRIVRVFEPIRPFSFNGDLVRGGGMTLFERVGSKKWQPVDLPDQIFGWRKLTAFEAARLKGEGNQKDENEKDVELGWNPGQRAAATKNKVFGKFSPKRVKRLYDLRPERVAAKDVMIRKRNRANTVRVLSNSKRMDEYHPSSGLDLAAWLQHVLKDEGFQYTQSKVAGRIERISPATVIDKVLSRQWGKTANSQFYDKPFADFCIPAQTVPSKDAETLFPEDERQDNYWPQSDVYKKVEKEFWKQKASAFKYSLQTNLRLLALAFPQSMIEENPSVERKIKEPKNVITYIANELNKKLDQSQKKIPRKLVNKYAQNIDSVHDDITMTSAIEELGFAFFEAHLPDKVKLRKAINIFDEHALEDYLSSRRERFSADDWLKIADGLDLIKSKMSGAYDQFEPGTLALDQLIEDARKNYRLVQNIDNVVENMDVYPTLAEILQVRLDRKMTGKKSK